MSGRRTARVAHQIHAELARLLLTDVNDRQLRSVTISDVRVSSDLRIARVFVRSLAEVPQPEAVVRALERGGAFLRARLGETLQLRRVPELHFEYDQLLDQAARVDSLLAGIRRRDESP